MNKSVAMANAIALVAGRRRERSGFLRCAAHDKTVSSFGRNDEFVGRWIEQAKQLMSLPTPTSRWAILQDGYGASFPVLECDPIADFTNVTSGCVSSREIFFVSLLPNSGTSDDCGAA
jgi:hypothetical protein